jgi:hypothetical protein
VVERLKRVHKSRSTVKKVTIISAIIATIAVIALFSLLPDEFAVAKPQSKVHFTKTIMSSPDPGIGQGDYQFALLLSPNQGSLYSISLTYTSNEPLEIIVLHELGKDDIKDQPTWTVDGNTIYGMSVIEQASKARSFDFTGAALAFRSKNSFTVTASVDGWIRGQPAELVMQKFEIKEKSFSLPESHIPVTIPMRGGFYGEDSVYYILTDSSNKTLAEKVTEKQSWPVQFSPKLRWTPDSSKDTVYAFTNGISGDGIYGFQEEVFASTPQTDGYSSLREVVAVTWKSGQRPEVLNSAEDVLKAEKDSRVKLAHTNVTINAPQVVWPSGQLFVRNDTDTTNETSFERGQVIEINKDAKKVTFIAHRGWGADGRTIYYIVPDATPAGPADLMGVPTSSKLANVLSSTAFVDMYQFKNGFEGPGQLGFQASLIASKLDESYTPICRVSIVEWKDASTASVLETVSDINNKKSDGSIFVTLARPLSNDHVVNCPLIEPKNNVIKG